MKKPPGYDNEIIYYNPKMLYAKPKKRKIKYIVCYKNHYDYGDGVSNEDGYWGVLDVTMAVSPEKAISNARYKNDVHHYANQFHEWAGDGMRWIEFKAFTEEEYKNYKGEIYHD